MRLVTRSDFDGLACGALLKEAGLIDDYLFVHPKDIQDGLIKITANDILANVPYAEGCGMWFDHHSSEGERLGAISYRGMSKMAPSCARVVYDFLGGDSRFSSLWYPLLEAVDKVDSANLTSDDILNPKGWILIGFLMDPRTGLGRYHHYTISNYQLMLNLMEECHTLSADQILNLPDVQERVNVYFEHENAHKAMLLKCSTQVDETLLVDLRYIEKIFVGNRFVLYSLFPDIKVSIHIAWTKSLKSEEDEHIVSLSMGDNILNRTNKANLGSIALHFGGGGHENVATCQILESQLEETLETILSYIHEANTK